MTGPRELVEAFIADYFRWNEAAHSRMERAGRSNDAMAATMQAAKEEYAALIERHCPPGFAAGSCSFGSPSSHDPATEGVVAVAPDGDRCVVATRQVKKLGNYESVTDYEYFLRQTDGRWYLEGLCFVDEGERFECLAQPPSDGDDEELDQPDPIAELESARIDYPLDLAFQVERAMAGLQLLTATHDRLFQIGRAAWGVDQSAGTITFTAPDGIVATAPVQIVGTYNTTDGTWLWGWDNPSVRPGLAADVRQVWDYGAEHGFEILTTGQLACPEEQCWDFAALACLLVKAQGAYRGPAGTARVFMTFGTIQMSKGA